MASSPLHALPDASSRQDSGHCNGKSQGWCDRPPLASSSPPVIRRELRLGGWWIAAVLAAWFILMTGSQAFCSGGAMNGPPEAKPSSSAGKPLETSVVRIALMGAIQFYQKRISPIGAARCGFHPSCSSFGLQAVREKGALLGVIMTADRLTRCNIFKGPGPDYLPLPDGRLFDPVSGNILSDR